MGFPTRRNRPCRLQPLESRRLLAADSGFETRSLCFAVGDPHAQPSVIPEVTSFIGPVATTALPPVPADSDTPDPVEEPASETVAAPEVTTNDELDAQQTDEPEAEPGKQSAGVGTQETLPDQGSQKGDFGSTKDDAKDQQDVLEDEKQEELPAENAAAPQVTQVSLGGDQRSMVNELLIVFDSLVELDDTQGDLIRVINRNTLEEVNVVSSAETVDGVTQVRVRFANGPSVGSTSDMPSLDDGNYELVINAARVTGDGGLLDGDGDGVAGDDYHFGTQASDGFFRLFGDQDGDRSVDDVDYAAFVEALLSTSGGANFVSVFDSDDDGDVDGKDYGQYFVRHQTNLEFV